MEFSEHIKTANVEDVVLQQPLHPPSRGTLCITGHHLLFSHREEQDSSGQVLLLLRNIDAIEKSVENLSGYLGPFTNVVNSKRASGSSGTIIIKCKDLFVLQLDIPGMEQCLNIAQSIETLSCLDCVADMYPFFYRPCDAIFCDQWGLSNPEKHYTEMEELLLSTSLRHWRQDTRGRTPPTISCRGLPNWNHDVTGWSHGDAGFVLPRMQSGFGHSVQHERWRLSTVNRDYSVCVSYPTAVIVPKEISDDTLKKVAKFRQGGRFPVLCYYHRKNGMVIMRSGQPLTGANRKRCKEDERLLQAVIEDSDKGYIIDMRSAQQAQQARMTGGGFESKSCYNSWRRLHRHMERGKTLQESLIKLVEACADKSHNMGRWLSKLENSKWLSHVQTALSTAGLLVECLERDGHSVLIHDSDGIDSTLLVSTLAQLIMDPSCRTLEGFLGLLEREFVQAGHPFQQRCAHSAFSHARLQQESPVFLLMLDCVWQIWRQFPLALGFSEALLLRLATEAYASNYGTFLSNSDMERHAAQVKDKTQCLFRALLKPREREQYTNQLYEHTELAIWPSVHPQSLQLWRGFFLRWTQQTRHLEEVQQEIRNMVIESGKTALSF
ncbi:myotubularin-related protein 9 isoform X2 [Nerophis ophidion]|uniref:myotubularin-related protein 9 isoform X2 n=1 Tax=Nerophis ophidion TaxID=159077 RepID=UPI002ADFC3B5|nr:myotubularin-related protein 9 isoform X2 [Nerophis ophidion]